APGVAGKTFAVDARRSQRDKIPFRSADVARELGARLLPHSAGVDLSRPQFTAFVEVHPREAYFFSDRIAGSSGLPIGVGGHAVALVSGGFDSVVAAWLMQRRGVVLDYVFCNLGGTPHRDEALRVMKVISDGWSFGYRPRVHIVDFRPLVEELAERCPPYLWQVVIKRQMVRAAERVARMVGAVGIVTGESVGQVSSQTLQNLVVISAAATVPILRPLAGSNKEEIVDYARRIGSYELSARVPEYCALVRRRPATHAGLEQVERAEADLDPEKLTQLVDERANVDLRALDLDKASAPELEVESIPEGATVIDLRSPVAFNSWHYPGARRLGYFEALKAFPSFDRQESYLFYCEIGLKSAHLAEVMREAGFRANHFKDGLRNLLRYVEGQDPALRALMSPALLTD
ncbi:MAG: tRNA 4-thiouridine(8) synthase ThiI, partial [bacterium]|nr:tRNA 4-thiouridine(8) synthase ThiI [bacterium]